MLLRATLRQGLQTLLAHQVPSAQLAAELLLMHVLGRDRAYLHTHADEELPPQSLQRYSQLIAERTHRQTHSIHHRPPGILGTGF